MPNPKFQLKLHLPYRALRQGQPHSKVSGKCQNKWTDVSFLKRRTSHVNSQEVYGIYRAHISLVISGSSDRRWVAYGFDSHDFDDEDDDEDNESEYGDSEGNGLQDGDFLEDLMTGGDTNKPIYDAREHFLQASQKQISRRGVEEWKYITRWIERNVDAYVGGYSSVSP
jgi:hypothetical protein